MASNNAPAERPVRRY